MAKRTRYTARPAGRRPAATKPALSGATTVRSSGLTSMEVERAAQLEAELMEREREAIADNARRRARSRGLDHSIAADAGVPLSRRAAQEYAYVARDVRRIAITAAVMFGLLGALWAIVNFGGVGLS